MTIICYNENMSKLSILVVEDDALTQKTIAAHLRDHEVDFASDLLAAAKMIREGRHDICFIDLKLGPKDSASGLDLIPLATARGAYSVVMSGHDSEPMVERAYAMGCDDFYAKGNEETNIGAVIARFLNRRDKSDGVNLFNERFITQDTATKESITNAFQYAASELPVLILGPTGTGKTSLARLLHDQSGRPGEFVAINCSAYTEDLLEAELFGFRKGAFTGANENRKGKLLLADQGTLFLDEIGTMSLKMQTKLLKAIEERSFYPLGSERAETSRFRIISATLEDLQSLIKAGKMRFDFFQRIHGLTIDLKPLTERKGDIFPLIAHFTRGGKRLAFSPEAKELLTRYDWPGNIRELKKFVELLSAGHEGLIKPDSLRGIMASARSEATGGEFMTEEQYRCALDHGLGQAVDRFTDAVIRRNLAENEGHKTKTLSDLKISTRLLYSSLSRQGERPENS